MKQRVKQLLSRRQKHHIVDPGREPSAVLIPLYCREGRYHILFIQRTEKVRTHKGQIAFPGGAYQKDDLTLLGTALRESAEEIGLKPEDVEVAGELDDEFSVASNYIISPFVAFIPWPYQFRVDGEETAEIIEIPVPALLDGKNVSEEQENLDGKAVTAYSYHYRGKVIWGATARILTKLLDILAQSTQTEC